MKSGKHILILTPGFPANEADDSCIPALQVFVKAFHELYPGYFLSIVTLHYPFTNQNYSWNGINVFPCNGKNKRGLFRLKTLSKAKKYFNSINGKQKVDFIHSFWLGECALLGEKLARKFNIPHLITIMGQDANSTNRFLNKKLLKQTPKIVQSNRHGEMLEKNLGQSPYGIIGFGIEEEPIELNDIRSIDILSAGSLIELKQYEFLIRVAAQLLAVFPHLKVVLAGDGPQRKFLEKLAEELHVKKQIHFVGQVSRHEVLKLMKNSKVFFHPSSTEGFGFVFAEARMNGMAIVSTPVGFAESSENWMVVSDLDEMVTAVKHFLTTKIEFKGEIIYSSRQTSENYKKIYDDLIETGLVRNK